MNTFLSRIYYIRSFAKFKNIGRNIMLSRNGQFKRPEEITFGNNVFINNSFYISARNLIFGSDIMIGPRLIIECDNHIYDKIGSSMFKNKNDRDIGFVNIESDVWIGASVVILPNVIIGEGCIVGAGSVVTKPLPPYTICVGNPCNPIKVRFNIEQLQTHLILVNSKKKMEDLLIEYRKFKLL